MYWRRLLYEILNIPSGTIRAATPGIIPSTADMNLRYQSPPDNSHQCNAGEYCIMVLCIIGHLTHGGL